MRPQVRLLLDNRGAGSWALVSVVVATVATVATLGWLLSMVAIIDDVFLQGDAAKDVAGAVAVMVALLVARAAAVWLGELCSWRASTLVRSGVRRSLVDHLVAVGPALTTGTGGEVGSTGPKRGGELASTIGAGVEALDPYVSRFMPAAAMTVIGPLAVAAAVVVIDPWSTLVLLFTGPMLVLLLAVIGRRTQTLTRRRFDELGWLSSFYLDMIRGLGTLKAFGRAHDGADTIESVSKRFGDTTMEVLRTAFQTSLVMEWAATAATALVAVEVSFRMVEGSLSFRSALAVLVLTPEFFVPFRRLALEYHAGQSGQTAVEHIEQLKSLPTLAAAHHSVPCSVAPSGESPSAGDPPALRIRGLRVRYPDSATDALVDVDLDVAAGETVALCGPSGAGKTTLARVLLGFVTPGTGTIEMDGSSLRSTDIGQWRRQIAWVPQRPTLIAGTIAQNIALGDPSASREQILTAARTARADAFISKLPEGFDTLIGERGSGLSGGQKQRLAIARAALVDAPFVLFDEFTAHLDERTEAELLEAAQDLLSERTALVIAHRPATIAIADRVVDLEGGQVVRNRVNSTGADDRCPS